MHTEVSLTPCCILSPSGLELVAPGGSLTWLHVSVCLQPPSLAPSSAEKDQDLCTLFACALICSLCCLPLLVLCLCFPDLF